MLTAFNRSLDESPDRLGRMFESNPKEDIALLRNRFSEDGYLLLKSLLKKICSLKKTIK